MLLWSRPSRYQTPYFANLSNAVSGIIVPYDCIYKGYYLNLYQSAATSGNIRFQTWTGKVPNNTASAATTGAFRTFGTC